MLQLCPEDFYSWIGLMLTRPKHPAWRMWRLPAYWRARREWIARVEAFKAEQEKKS